MHWRAYPLQKIDVLGLLLLLATAGLAAERVRAVGVSRTCALRRRTPSAAGSVLVVPHAAGEIVLDGDMDDPGWTAPDGVARTGPFSAESGAAARPYSDARLLWGDGYLYLALYAADEDIRAAVTRADGPVWLDDSFHLVFRPGAIEYCVDVSARGVVADALCTDGATPDSSWNSGAHVSGDLDGTPNDPADSDEEWVVEMAIPLASLGLRGERGERLGFSVRRCDAPKGEPRVCSGWGAGQPSGQIILE